MTSGFLSFLSLLGCVLFGQPVPRLSDDEWRSALRLARGQSVDGLLYEAALKADGAFRPPRDVLMELLGHVVRVEQANRAMAGRIVELFDAYEKVGAESILLKGHGVAANWPHPEWRTPGDIDIYVLRNFSAADRWARNNGTDVSAYDPQTDKHVEFHWKGLSVELHFRPAICYNRRLNRRLQAVFAEGLAAEAPLSLTVCGRAVRLLPPTVGLFHLLVHFANHLVSEGVGLRQLCDIVLYVHRRHAQVDGGRLTDWLTALRLCRLTDALATVATEHLELPAAELPFRWKPDCRRAAVLLNLVAESGNYGRNYSAGCMERRFHRLYKLRLLAGRSRRVASLWPEELFAAWRGKAVNMVRFYVRALCR